MNKFGEILKLLDDIIIEYVFQPFAEGWYELTDRSQYFLASQCFVGISLCFIIQVPGLGIIAGQMSPLDLLVPIVSGYSACLFIRFLRDRELKWHSGVEEANTLRLFWWLRIGAIFILGYREVFRVALSTAYRPEYFVMELAATLFILGIYFAACSLPPPNRFKFSKWNGKLAWQM